VYASTIDAGKMYTDQTGRFPVLSGRGIKHIMVLYEYDGKAIMADPIKIENVESFCELSKSWNKNGGCEETQPQAHET
jgi:hypothetical protein